MRGRGAARRGSFALEPIEALPRYAERIRRLSQEAVEPNPFFLPEFLGPAAAALKPGRLRLAVITERDDLLFFAPMQLVGGRFGSGHLKVWTHPYAPLGVPLVDRRFTTIVPQLLLDHLAETRRSHLALPQMPLEGPVAKLLCKYASVRGAWHRALVEKRPILHAGDAGAGGFDAMLPAKRRKELERQLRRLAEEGLVSLMTAKAPADVEAAFDTFVAVEASGWKGRRGTAMARSGRIRDFARQAVLDLARRGVAEIDLLRCGDRAAAVLIRFETGGLAVPWKIAFDEGYAAFSPGKQLMSDASRRWMSDGRTVRVDPVCDPDNAMLSLLWEERERYGTLLLGTSRSGLGIDLRARAMNARASARKAIKQTLKSGLRRLRRG